MEKLGFSFIVFSFDMIPDSTIFRCSLFLFILESLKLKLGLVSKLFLTKLLLMLPFFKSLCSWIRFFKTRERYTQIIMQIWDFVNSWIGFDVGIFIFIIKFLIVFQGLLAALIIELFKFFGLCLWLNCCIKNISTQWIIIRKIIAWNFWRTFWRLWILRAFIWAICIKDLGD